jgi:hypothetical protein
MKKLLVLLILLTVVQTASAAIQVGDKLTYLGQTPGKSYSTGGEFSWTLTTNTNYPGPFVGGATSTFYSFCAETIQVIASPVYVVKFSSTNSTGAYSLTDKAAWLIYREGVGGNAAVPTHATLTSTSAGTIQWAIWNEMGYSSPFSLPSAALYNSWFGPGGAYYADTAWQNKAGGATVAGFSPFAQIAWLSTNYADVPNGKGHAQDQVVFFSAGRLQEVPEPASIAIWSLLCAGWTGLAVVRRRNRLTSRPGWSPENRQAILSIVEMKH